MTWGKNKKKTAGVLRRQRLWTVTVGHNLGWVDGQWGGCLRPESKHYPLNLNWKCLKGIMNSL